MGGCHGQAVRVDTLSASSHRCLHQRRDIGCGLGNANSQGAGIDPQGLHIGLRTCLGLNRDILCNDVRIVGIRLGSGIDRSIGDRTARGN